MEIVLMQVLRMTCTTHGYTTKPAHIINNYTHMHSCTHQTCIIRRKILSGTQNMNYTVHSTNYLKLGLQDMKQVAMITAASVVKILIVSDFVDKCACV